MRRVGKVLGTTSLCLVLVALASVSAHADPHALPLGDGKVSMSGPRVGWVYACSTPSGGQGASGPTPWITGSTWDPAVKPQVQGAVTWPQASSSVRATESQRTITTMGVPVGATTGTFPISPDDPAYQYDRNPNAITPSRAVVRVPRQPKRAATPSCLSLGVIGYTTTGVAIFDALDALNRDAVAHEVQDSCDGHPERTGQYHYHSGSRCLLATATRASTLIGYALDGFGIYVERDSSGALLTNADLDACHGRTSPVRFNGTTTRMYHYVITAEYPYTLGCYRGTPTNVAVTGSAPRPPGPPPPGAPAPRLTSTTDRR